MVFKSSNMEIVSGRCLECQRVVVPSKVMPNSAIFYRSLLRRSVVARHDLPPMFGEMHKHGLPHPNHPGTLDIDKASRRLLALPEPVVIDWPDKA